MFNQNLSHNAVWFVCGYITELIWLSQPVRNPVTENHRKRRKEGEKNPVVYREMGLTGAACYTVFSSSLRYKTPLDSDSLLESPTQCQSVHKVGEQNDGAAQANTGLKADPGLEVWSPHLSDVSR